ncbi:MAG: hypothetical protein E6G70_06545 [Alphaproteobacteria bacterium]|nr:MAG: hypothetical protein E6G70_06545 [Alphaproteobacteria bacterium]
MTKLRFSIGLVQSLIGSAAILAGRGREQFPAQTFSVEMQMRMGLAEYKVVATGNGRSLVPNASHR